MKMNLPDDVHQVCFQTWPVHDVGSDFVFQCSDKFLFVLNFQNNFTNNDGLVLLEAVRDYFASAVVMETAGKIRMGKINVSFFVVSVYAATRFLLKMLIVNSSIADLVNGMTHINSNNQSVK